MVTPRRMAAARAAASLFLPPAIALMVAADLDVFCRSARLELPPLPEVWPAVFRDDLLFFFGELGLFFLAVAGAGWPPLVLFRFAVVVAADALVFSFGFGLCAVVGENFEGAFEFGLLLLLFPPLALELLPSFVFGGEPYAAAFIGCRAFGWGGKCIMWYAI